MEYIHIGKIVATFGVKGELVLLHALNKRSTLKGVEAVFIEERAGSWLPYFLESAKAKSHTEAYIKVEGVDTKEAASKLIQKKAWLLDADFRRLAGAKSPVSYLGYQLIHEEEALGPIEEVIEQPHQVLLRITYKGNEALIPLHDETLLKVDRDKQELHVVLPEGLLEIYE
ncbi:16S rRNA processing protein RimM [Filimonas lacunae]|uniref:Ribosome maturation factor RimM n=1 Tax=Filimonas lacunae TaxID=477680 RepID=A0A173MRM6_9BACT|nr:ribosome maturation factor RimM [Filimonas lacunae]BAV10302.1 16S rRNA processing protein RimM [Filimonas lacunae]SIT17310.1 16S rRNA processing protein RimM [Filimonas lacunae]